MKTHKRLIVLLFCLFFFVPAARAREAEQINPELKLGKIDLEKNGEQYTIVLRDGRKYEAQEFFDILYEQQQNHESSFWFTIFNITSPIGMAWIMVGISGQLCFTLRMLTQWIKSERKKKSVISESFWWMSLVGAAMMLIYFSWRKDIIGILGQSTSFFIYGRNLWLIHSLRQKKKLEIVIREQTEPQS